MHTRMTAEERLERLRLLAERRELDRLDQRTPSQIRRLAELARLLETSEDRPVPDRAAVAAEARPAPAPRPAGGAARAKTGPRAA